MSSNHQNHDSAESTTQVYKRRWIFLVFLTILQALPGTSYVMFGQISKFFVAYFNVTYTQVDWLTIAINAAPLLLTLPISYMAFRNAVRFRGISIICAVCSIVAFSCFALSMTDRSLFALSVVGQTVSGFSLQLVMTTPAAFAAVWFPENEVGTAIGVNALGKYIGNGIGLLVPTYLLAHHSDYNTTSMEEKLWLERDKNTLIWIYSACVLVAGAVAILVCIFVTAVPPKPPTLAQQSKRTAKEFLETPSNGDYWRQTKAVLTNRTFICAAFVFAILFQTPTVEYTMMAQIVSEFSTKHHLGLKASIIGSGAMCYITLGNAVGTFVAGRIVNKYKKYKRLTIAGTTLCFLSTIIILLGDVFAKYQLLYVGNALLGVFVQISMVTIYDMTTQHTYPVDEAFVSIWLISIVLPTGLFYGPIGRVIFNKFGGTGVLIFQSSSFVLGVLLCFLFKPEYGRLNVQEREESDLNETKPLLTNQIQNGNGS